MGKKSGSGSGMNNPDHISESSETIVEVTVKYNKYLNSLMRNRDPGWKKFGSRMGKIRIRDKYPGSATLLLSLPMSMMHFLRISYKDRFERKKTD